MDAIQILLEWRGFMTVADASKFLQLTPAHLRKLLNAGTFPGYRVCGSWRINPSDLVSYIYDRSNQ